MAETLTYALVICLAAFWTALAACAAVSAALAVAAAAVKRLADAAIRRWAER